MSRAPTTSPLGPTPMEIPAFTSRHQESNPGPSAYKADALTRLSYAGVSSKGVEPSLAASSRQCLCHWATRTCGDRSGVRESESRCPRMTLVSRVSRVGSSRSVSRGDAGSRTPVLDHSAMRFSSRVVPTTPRCVCAPCQGFEPQLPGSEPSVLPIKRTGNEPWSSWR